MQRWQMHITHRGVLQSSGLFHSEVEAAMKYDRCVTPLLRPCSLSSHVPPHLSLARSLKGEAAVVNFKTPAEANDALAAETAAAEGGAGAERSGDESDEDVDEQLSSDAAAEAEIIPVSNKRQPSSDDEEPRFTPPRTATLRQRSHRCRLR